MTTQTTFRKLYRSHDNRMIAGVCGGIAEYTATDPTVVRVLFVLLAFITGGASLLAYPILWLMVPEAPRQPAPWTPTAPAAPTAPPAA
jgi:phage shock protein C